MTPPLDLPCFDSPSGPGPAASATAGDPPPEERLAAYEEGYKAGWEDALSARSTEEGHLGAELAQTLQDLSFPYHEARAHVLGALRPLLSAMAERVLPTAAHAQFSQTVIEAAMTLADSAANPPVEITVNPAALPTLQALLDAADPPMPLVLAPDEALGPAQAWLKGAAHEQEVDIDAVLSGIGSALEAFLSTPEETRSHG